MYPVVFLIDVDDTLQDGDRFIADLNRHLVDTLGIDAADQYWKTFEMIRLELGYADYLGALQHYHRHNPLDQRCLASGDFILDYPFSSRLYPNAMEVIAHLGKWGPSVIISDGDAVLQLHKIQQSGLWKAVAGRVLIYIHKEQALGEVRKLFPAQHYVLVDDKLRILTAVKKIWRDGVTTVFPRQGHYARDPHILAECPPADISIAHIGDLLQYDLPSLLAAGRKAPQENSSTSNSGENIQKYPLRQ
ncbi:MAG: HAD family hydrolase [Phycisphaerae bacterium]